MSLILDNRTLLLVAGALYVLLPLSVWLILRMPRQQAALTWCAGGVVCGIGLLLMGAHGQLANEISYAMGHPLWTLGALLVSQSLRMDCDRAWSWWPLGLGVLGFAGVLLVLLPWAPPEQLGVLIRAVNLLSVGLLIISAWQLARAEKSRNALTIAVAYGVQALSTAINLLMAVLGFSHITVQQTCVAGALVSLTTLAVALVASMAYLGLALERAERTRLAAARELARQQQWQEKRQALAHLDRERLLCTLTDSLGHAMAQPLTAALLRVQTELQALKMGVVNEKRLQIGLGHVVSELRRTGETVDRIRHFLRPAPTLSAPVDLTQVLRRLDLMLRQEAINHQTQLVFKFKRQREPVWVLGDELQLTQAVLQLVRNALRAVSQISQRQVTVSLNRTERQVRLCVSDSGPGLPPEVLRRTAKPMAHAAHSLQGVGLFVVEGIALSHHGELLLDNSAYSGAVVTLVLPCQPCPSHPPHDSTPARP